MNKYSSSTINGSLIKNIILSQESFGDLEEIQEMSERGVLTGDFNLKAKVVVKGDHCAELFDYTFNWYEIENFSDNDWVDSFLCSVQNDSRIEVNK